MRKTLCLLISIFFTLNGFSQVSELDSDELFQRARSQAFDEKNYPLAIETIKQALHKSPDYTDLAVFLGRLYTWSDQVALARETFEKVYAKNVSHEDFYVAFANFENWENNEARALEILNYGLNLIPKSEDLLYLKAKILYSSDQYEKSADTINELLKINSKNTEARELYNKIKDYVSKNAIGINYNFMHFDKQFADDWHLVGVSYKRRTAIGSVIFRTNYANKFADNGVQFELEAYPRLSKMFYMYVGTGYSNNVGIFPKFRTGASLYANLPKSFEGEVGFRQLYFSDNLFMYTGSVGKYYQNFWFNLRTFITPSSNNISHSYTLTTRYYTKGANDYLSFQLGTGISPEESMNNLLEVVNHKMKTFKIGADYNFSLNRRNIVNLSATYFNQEYRPKTIGNLIDLSVGLIRNF